jgi:hypothetical protein
LPDKSTVLALQEIGLLKALTFRESRLLLLRAMRESTEATLLVWEFSLFSSFLDKMLKTLV